MPDDGKGTPASSTGKVATNIQACIIPALGKYLRIPRLRSHKKTPNQQDESVLRTLRPHHEKPH